MKKSIVGIVAVAALAVPAGWISAAQAQSGPDPDANGDVHSNCHTGSKFLGAGGEDRVKVHGNGEVGDCVAAPVTPGAPPAAPGAPGAAVVGEAAAPGRAPAVTSPAAGPAAPVVDTPRTTG